MEEGFPLQASPTSEAPASLAILRARLHGAGSFVICHLGPRHQPITVSAAPGTFTLTLLSSRTMTHRLRRKWELTPQPTSHLRGMWAALPVSGALTGATQGATPAMGTQTPGGAGAPVRS